MGKAKELGTMRDRVNSLRDGRGGRDDSSCASARMGKSEAQLVGIIDDDWDIFSICRNPIMGQSKLNGMNKKKIEEFPMPALRIATKPIEEASKVASVYQRP